MMAIHMEHKDGVPWWEAPIPFKWHFCSVHTRGFDRGLVVERCACGAIRAGLVPSAWMQRNSRRRARKRKR